MGSGSSIRQDNLAAARRHWETAKMTVHVVAVKTAAKPAARRTLSSDDQLAPVLPSTSSSSPTRIRRLKKGQSSNLEAECHSLHAGLPGGRVDAYRVITDQLERRLNHATRRIHKYVGTACRDGVRLFATDDGGIDIVRSRMCEVHLDTFARCVWGTLTTVTSSNDDTSTAAAAWTVQPLDRIDDNTCYTCVTVPDPTKGHTAKLVLHVLHKRLRAANRVVLVFRNVVHDPLFPPPPVALRMSGWVVLERDQQATHARTFVQLRPTTTRNQSNHETSWVRDVAEALFHAVDAANTSKWHLGSMSSDVKRKHSAASNGNALECR
ncbi:Aste57867_18756 [Aphanomyces stellatus]|uniref:Aste57867_18756 protein n=1 Tax=Aphanomyces stellatus TaxID=120398 RepID=A0A485LCL8_9STRA|nr:hypothetical protein As57867_018692 [Aphanomyces stellatus]VFT95490.1 Aste57867_18756 [Aphanomyces stellatus]